MGDTGSLALGGLFGALAITTNTQLLLVILGGLFVIETMSVILQVISFRGFHRRIFRMSPIHHHFELAGWPEFTVIVRFWIIAGLCVAVGLGLYYADFIARGGLDERAFAGRACWSSWAPAWPGRRGRAPLVQRQGAEVRVTESRPAEEVANGRGELRAMGDRACWPAATSPRTWTDATLVVTGPGVPRACAGARRGRGSAGIPRVGRDGTGGPAVRRALRRRHRHERQDDGDGHGRVVPARRRPGRRGVRQHRPPVPARGRSRSTTRSSWSASSFQLRLQDVAASEGVACC